MDLDVVEHLCYRIANTPIRKYPFPHQVVESVFPDAYYARLLASLPPTAAYRPLHDPGTAPAGKEYPERLVCHVAEAAETGSAAVREFWTDLNRWLTSVRFHDFLVAQYDPHAAARFGAGAALNTKVSTRLVRDFSRYAIGPHTDSPSKLISLLFYLPRDESMRHLGTSLYAPVDPAFRCPGSKHHDFAAFRRIAAVPYVPNTLFLFFKTDRAFHGVEPIEDANIERNLLLYNISVRA